MMLLLVLSAGCRRNADDEGLAVVPLPATLFASRGLTLDDGLRMLEKELNDAGDGLDKSAVSHLLRAEAISDRLLEARLPFTWLHADSYSLEAYVRQIQALADRIVAEIRNNDERPLVAQDVSELRKKVKAVRHDLARGGGNPPWPLDSLLAGIVADSTLPSDAGE